VEKRFHFTTTSGYASYQFNGGLSTSAGATGTPSNVSFFNLSPVVSADKGTVGVLISSGTATWTGLIFSNLNGTKSANKYYLGYNGANPQVLTIPEVRFRNKAAGVEYSSFNAANSPGTICAGNNVMDPGGIVVQKYFTNDKGIGGSTDKTDSDP
jgi:hypothetical protein